MRRFLREAFETVGLVLLILFAVNLMVDKRHVEGPSMQPTLVAGHLLIANKLAFSPLIPRAFASHNADNADYDHPVAPNRGDIVIVKRPASGDGNELVKRVIARAGETIAIQQGAVFIDGVLLDEPYVVNHDYTSLQPTKIPAGHVFVMGDNRANSRDSRHFGPVPVESLLGRVWLRYWPLDQLTVFSAP